MAVTRRVLHLPREERHRDQSRHLRWHKLRSRSGDGPGNAPPHRYRDEADGRTYRLGDARRRCRPWNGADLPAEHFLLDRGADRAHEIRDALQGRLRRAHSQRRNASPGCDSRDDSDRRGSGHVGRDKAHQVALSGADAAGGRAHRFGACRGRRHHRRPVSIHREWNRARGDAQHLGAGRRRRFAGSAPQGSGGARTSQVGAGRGQRRRHPYSGAHDGERSRRRLAQDL